MLVVRHKESKVHNYLLDSQMLECNALCSPLQWCRNRGGQGGHWPPQYLADQLTLFQPGRADYPHLMLLAPPMFFTFRHHWCGFKFWDTVIFQEINLLFEKDSSFKPIVPWIAPLHAVACAKWRRRNQQASSAIYSDLSVASNLSTYAVRQSAYLLLLRSSGWEK